MNSKENPTIITCSMLTKIRAEFAKAAQKDMDEEDPDEIEAARLIKKNTVKSPSQQQEQVSG